MRSQFRTHEHGGVCCSSFNDQGERIAPEHMCDKCKVHFARDDEAIPDPYRHGIAALRAAEQRPPTALEQLEQEWATVRRRQLAREYAEAAEWRALADERRAAATTHDYTPPDPYAPHLAMLRAGQ